MLRPQPLLALLPLLLLPRAAAAEVLWIEGEAAGRHTFNQHGWYSASDVHLDWLSPGSPGERDGAWLAHFTNQDSTPEATWDLAVAEGGRYTVWLRTNPYRVRLAWRLDDGAAQEPDLEADARERLNLIVPRIDIRFLAWVAVGEVELTPGTHSLTVTLTHHPDWGDNPQVHGAVDVVCLANEPWSPAGAIPPGGLPEDPGPEDWFPLVPDDAALDRPSVADVSGLLHTPAGSHGPLQRAGSGLAFSDGTPVKLWGLGARAAATPELQERQARFYARHGVNVVRQHPVQDELGLLQPDPEGGGRRLDPARLDRFDRWFSTLGEHGIYMDWSPFYPHVIGPDDGYPPDLYAELPDRRGGKSTSGVVGFVPEAQQAQWEWLRTLLEHANPYTGLRYADDPALAILEVHNEDSLFWHAPLNTLAAGEDLPLHTALLKRLWMEWLRQRYGDDEALAAAWGHSRRDGDSVDNPDMPLYGAWEMEADGPRFGKAAAAPRLGDFIRFLAETQRGFFERRIRQLRDLGFAGLTVTTAWRAGGPAAAAANLWCDQAADAIDRHRYVGGGEGGHAVAPGTVEVFTHLDRPGEGLLSAGLFQVEDRPFVLSEWTSKPPNPWRAEAAPLVAFYGLGLQGWDASFHFMGRLPRLGSGWPRQSSYVTETPLYLGQFPALALAIHRGHLTEGPLLAARRVTLDQACSGFDAFSQALPGGGFVEDGEGGTLTTPPEALAMGRVSARVADDQPRASRGDWEALREGGVISSATGELVWDTEARVVTVRTERTQGVIGFAGGATWELPGVHAEVHTEYVSLLLSPLDDRPLTGSARILVTALARDRQTGTVYSADDSRLEALGGPPLLLEPVRAVLTFIGEPLTGARALDVHGGQTGREVERDGNRVTIDGRWATPYYEVVREAPPVEEPDAGGAGDAAPAGQDAGDAGIGGPDTSDSGRPPGRDAAGPDGDAPTGARQDGCECALADAAPDATGLGRLLLRRRR